LRYIYLSILLFVIISYFFQTKNRHIEILKEEHKVVQNEPVIKKIVKPTVKRVSVSAKKKRFYAIMVPAINRVHSSLMQQYVEVSNDIKNGTNKKEVSRLKKLYRASSDKDLLLRLKPHPKSITLAQAALESAWGTSKFFLKANNVFGIHATNKNQPRMEAGGKKDVWVRKFNSIDDSIRAYYMILSRAKEYQEFRHMQSVTNDPYKLITKLQLYSGIGNKYPVALAQVIKHNNLIKYDY